MDIDLINITADFLSAGVEQGYKKGLRDTVKKLKKLTAAKKPNYFEVDYNLVDEKAIENFRRECFEVAGVGSYELEEELKELAAEIVEEGKLFEEFEERAREKMLEYIPLEDQAPSGWLETNFNTAVNSSYSAAQYNRLQDPDVKDLYPAYRYKTRGDERVRPEHEALEDQVFGNDDPLLDSVWPPNDWNCRCYMEPLDIEEAEAMGFDTGNERTEEEQESIINNVAPEFRRNPAKDNSIFGKWLDNKYKDMPPELVKEIKKQAKQYSKNG